MEIIIIIALILLNGVFSMSEMSLVSSRKFKLENAKKKGSTGAKTALELSENPTKFLSTVQIGITLIGILLGVYSGENLTTNVEVFFSQFEFLKPFAHNIAVVIIVVSVTYVSIVLGELLPKRLGLTFPEPIAIALAKPMKILSIITSPFVWLLTFTNDIILKLLGIKSSMDSKISEEEIRSMIKESSQGGEIQDIEQDIVERVFEMGDRKVNSLFTHRSDIVFFNGTDDLETIRQKINQEKHSAYPVCNNNDIDDILGIVLLKDLFTPDMEQNFDLKGFIKQPLFLNENTSAYKLLEQFKAEKMHYAIIVDEYGSTQGIVTMDDMIDALVGDVTEFNQEEYKIIAINDTNWTVDGQYSIIDFVKYFELELDDDYKDKFITVAGLILDKHNAIPDVGDKIIIENYQFEILEKDGQRIEKIAISIVN